MAAQPTKSKKRIKNVVLLGLLALALYNSVYFKPLDEVSKAKSDLVFDPKAAAVNFMETDLGSIQPMNASELLSQLETDFEYTLEEKGNKLGISKDYYFMIEDDAKVLGMMEENVLVSLSGSSGKELRIATDFIFGNSIREASGKFDIGNYQNTMDFNNISIELNSYVRNEILPPFIKEVKEGDQIYFKGAIKVNSKNRNLIELRVVPVALKIN